MATNWKSQQGDGMYSLQFETDDIDKYKLVEKASQMAIDGKTDVVEVVRCKDCKYCFDAIMGGMWCEHPDNIMPLGSNPRDFCSYGERREGQ